MESTHERLLIAATRDSHSQSRRHMATTEALAPGAEIITAVYRG